MAGVSGPWNELRRRLYTDDPEAVPQPGFPSHAQLVDWAKDHDPEAQLEIRNEALTILGEPGFPQQYAAMALLRALGVSVDGQGHGEDFEWVVVVDGITEVIKPMDEPGR